MNAKNLIILTLITVIVIIAAVMSVHPPTDEAVNEKQQIFPQLSSSLQEVTEIQITTKEDKFTMVRQGEQWGLKEKYNYPVALDKVRNLLFGLTDLMSLEGKTDDPTRYSKIGVEDVTEKEAKSTLLTVKKGQDNLVNLIVGNSHPAKVDASRQEIYIRKSGEKQAWLALGSLSLDKKAAEWLDKQIFDLSDHQRVRQVAVTQADGFQFELLKDAQKDEDYKFAKIPPGMNVKMSPYDMKQIAGLLSNLNITDVRPEKDIEFKKDTTTTAVLSTFDGLKVILNVTSKEGKYYAKFASEFVPPPVPPKEEAAKKEETKKDESKKEEPKDEAKKDGKSEADVKKEVETVKSKTHGWVFEIPQYKYNLLIKKQSDLFEEPKAPASEETGTPSTTNLLEKMPNTLTSPLGKMPSTLK